MTRPHGTTIAIAPPPIGLATGNTILTCAATLQHQGPSTGTTVPPAGLVARTTAPASTVVAPSQGPVAGSSHLHGTTTEHGGTSYQGGLTTTTDFDPILEQL
ncbi:unnamed protein product [Prunus armeniaca]